MFICSVEGGKKRKLLTRVSEVIQEKTFFGCCNFVNYSSGLVNIDFTFETYSCSSS